MGQIVPSVKDNVSRDYQAAVLHKLQMPKASSDNTPDRQAYEQRLRERVADLRKKRNWGQAEMAKALGLEMDTYKKYENRSPMPVYFVPRFAELVESTVEYVLTGEGEERPASTVGVSDGGDIKSLSEADLAEVFRLLLRTMDLGMGKDALVRELARSFPGAVRVFAALPEGFSSAQLFDEDLPDREKPHA